jgi:hypothetical protein
MVLLSRLIRTAAITGRTDTYDASWFAGRQGGRWANQTVSDAFPTLPPNDRRTQPATTPRPTADPSQTLQELSELHRRGVLTDGELERLRTRLGV